jgi:hypothetical protein
MPLSRNISIVRQDAPDRQSHHSLAAEAQLFHYPIPDVASRYDNAKKIPKLNIQDAALQK